MKAYWRSIDPRRRQLIIVLLYANAVSLLLFGLRVLGADSFRYWFLLWNLFLAWLPLIPAWLLVRRLELKRWREAGSISLTVLWLLLLPNSFYVLSDLIHLRATGEINLLYDAVLFSSFIFNAYVPGFLSLYLVHAELLKRRTAGRAHAIIGGVLLACGFAIYLGRTMRWNSWDILLNPFAVLFDVSDGFVNPIMHLQLFMTTGIFFLLLSSVYAVIWSVVRMVGQAPRP